MLDTERLQWDKVSMDIPRLCHTACCSSQEDVIFGGCSSVFLSDNITTTLSSCYLLLWMTSVTVIKSERYFNRFPTENLDKVRRLRARARRIIKENRRSSWQSFVSGLTSRTPVKKVWSMVHSLKGKGNFSSVKHLPRDGNLITTKEDIANELASSFSKISSSRNSTTAFQHVKNQQEKTTLDFDSTLHLH